MTKILALTSNPFDQERLRLDNELNEINSGIHPDAQLDFRLVKYGATSLVKLPALIHDENPDIIHFTGHGDEGGRLIFHKLNDDADPVEIKALTKIFSKIGKNVKCVVLNSCFSARQAKAISQFIPCVIGNKKAVDDDLAIQFSRMFYQMLSRGKNVETAFELACGVLPKNNNTAMLYGDESAKKLVLFNAPIIKAVFKMNKKGKPKTNNNGEYYMEISLQNVPKDVIEVTMNYNYKKWKRIKDRYEEYAADATGISIDASLYGNIELRAVLWRKNYGTCIVSSVLDALKVTYDETNSTQDVIDAMDYIGSH